MDLWTYGPVDLQTCGLLDLWTYAGLADRYSSFQAQVGQAKLPITIQSSPAEYWAFYIILTCVPCFTGH